MLPNINNQPMDRASDTLLSLIGFIKAHGRLPTNELILNDALFKIKTTDEILNPLRVFVTDKEFLKKYVKASIGDEFNVPTLKILKNENEILEYVFPKDCVIKPTHASGQFIIRDSDDPLDLNRIKSWLRLNYYNLSREANYRYLTPKIIVEPIVFEDPNPIDYKIFCLNGKPKIIWVDVDRATNHKRNIFDLNWNELPIVLGFPRNSPPASKPKNFNLMLDIASKLSQEFSLVRIDLYSDGQNVFVGEITNCSGSANERYDSFESEKLISKFIFS